MSEEVIAGGFVKSLASRSNIFLLLGWWCIVLGKILEAVIMEWELLKMKP